MSENTQKQSRGLVPSEPIILIIDGNGFLTPLKNGEESVIKKGNCFSSILSRSTAQAIFSR